MKSMRVAIIIERTDTGYSAYAPDLPGCVAAAASQEETVRLMREAITAYLGEVRATGGPSPRSSTVATEIIDVPA